MEFQDVVRKRRMVRNFQDRPIPPGVRDRIIGNALRAPSAGFSQGWAFLTFEGRVQTESFWTATFREGKREGFTYGGIFNAPLIVVPLSSMDLYLDRYAEADKGWTDRDPARWPVPYWHIDTGMASLLMLLTAVDAGLAALFFGIFDPDAFRAAFGVPDAYSPIGAIAIGYAAPDAPSPSLSRGRRPVSEVVHRGRW